MVLPVKLDPPGVWEESPLTTDEGYGLAEEDMSAP